MGWKSRGDRSYFYQSEREGGRVVSRYVGSGEAASLIARLTAIERQKREDAAFDRRAGRERAEKLAGRVARACRSLVVAAESILEAAGYHRRNRGPWRRRRIISGEASAAPTGGLASKSIPALADRYRAGEKAAWDEVRALLVKAEKGDKGAGRQVGELMRAEPAIAELAARDIARAVEGHMIRRTYGEDALGSAEAVRLKLAALRAELAGPNPSAIERLLAERVALCWMDYHHLEWCDVTHGSRSIPQADCTGRQRDRAHRRYLAALKALASVRKLPIVAIQVNVGDAPAPGRGG